MQGARPALAKKQQPAARPRLVPATWATLLCCYLMPLLLAGLLAAQRPRSGARLVLLETWNVGCVVSELRATTDQRGAVVLVTTGGTVARVWIADPGRPRRQVLPAPPGGVGAARLSLGDANADGLADLGLAVVRGHDQPPSLYDALQRHGRFARWRPVARQSNWALPPPRTVRSPAGVAWDLVESPTGHTVVRRPGPGGLLQAIPGTVCVAADLTGRGGQQLVTTIADRPAAGWQLLTGWDWQRSHLVAAWTMVLPARGHGPQNLQPPVVAADLDACAPAELVLADCPAGLVHRLAWVAKLPSSRTATTCRERPSIRYDCR